MYEHISDDTSRTIIAAFPFTSDKIGAPIVTILDKKLQIAKDVDTISAGMIRFVARNKQLKVPAIPNLAQNKATIMTELSFRYDGVPNDMNTIAEHVDIR